MGRLAKLKESFSSKKIGYEEFYSDFLQSLKKRNDTTNAYIEIFEQESLEKAKAFDKNRPAGKLAGIPLGIKDIISIKGHELNAASKILKGFKAPRSATVTERLEAEDAIFVGRTNCDEFAMGSSNENSAFGDVKNPLDLERTAGGSSGGSSAAVAAETCMAALGTDTGGSIRLPAGFCGITGLKPTYGRVSRSGVIAFASSLDQVGPMADDALDCAEVLQVIAGSDKRDATSMNIELDDYVSAAKKPNLKGLKIGLPKEFYSGEGLHNDVQNSIEQAKKTLQNEGAELVEISLPHTKYGIAVYYVVATAEASSNLARYDGVRYGARAENYDSLIDLIQQTRSEGFGEEVKRRVMLGTFALSSGYYDAYYSKAQYVRSKMQKEFLDNFKKVDLIFTPTAAGTAFKLGEKTSDPLEMYLTDIYTVTTNLAGMPGLAFPIGNDSNQMPIGAQFIGAPFQEAKMLSALAAFEKAQPFQKGELKC